MVMSDLVRLVEERGTVCSPTRVKHAESLGKLNPVPARLAIGRRSMRLFAAIHVDQMEHYCRTVKRGPPFKNGKPPAVESGGA